MKLEIPFDSDLKIIFELLDYNARLVGGCVRDYLLKGVLVDDVDIATPLLPSDVIIKLKKNFQVIPTGLTHGTITVIGERKYEITTLRSDILTNGRHAQVAFQTSYEEDAKRRDFTINALYCDYNGNLFDYFNGLKDLKNRCVKFIGNACDRIQEDYLRILRFFRFSMRFGNFDLDNLKTCYLFKESLKTLSIERITSEWFGIIEGQYFFENFAKFIPILEVLNFNNLYCDINSFQKLTKLGLTSLFYNENVFLRLSNSQQKYILALKTTNMNSQEDANLIFNKYGEDFFNDKQILENKQFVKNNIPKMPVLGNHLLSLGYTGIEIGKILKKLEKKWYAKFPISFNELIDEIDK